MIAARFSPGELQRFGEIYNRSLLVISVGPVAILCNLPRRWEKNEPAKRGDPVSLAELLNRGR